MKLMNTALATSLAVLFSLLIAMTYFKLRTGLRERRRAIQLLTEKIKMAALEEMGAGVAHEINNPLAIIRAKAQILRLSVERGMLDPKLAQETGLKIEQTVERIAKITNGLLAFARDGSRDPMERVQIDQLVDSTLELCRSRFINHGVELKISRPRVAIDLCCRPVEISQALLNLLNNAFDAAQQSRSNAAWVELVVEDLPSHVRVAVTDSGPGIPIENRAKIMQPFFSTKELGKGTGLGLSVSKGIVEEHGGVLEFRPDHEHTCFEMSFPK